MRKFVLPVLSVCLMFSGLVLAQRGTSEVSINGNDISVEYGRPSLEGRDMISRLPVGQTWRMGMNAATTLKTDAALDFGGKTVPAGTYTLTAKRVAEDSWHLIVADESGSATEVPLQTSDPDSPVETFTIDLTSKGGSTGHFSMAWGELKAGTEFNVQ